MQTRLMEYEEATRSELGRAAIHRRSGPCCFSERGWKMDAFGSGLAHKGRGVALRKMLGTDEDAIVRRTFIMRQIDDGRGAGRVVRDCDVPCRWRRLADRVLNAVDVVDHGEVGC